MTKVIYVQHKQSRLQYANTMLTTFILLCFAVVILIALICGMKRHKQCSAHLKKKTGKYSSSSSSPSASNQEMSSAYYGEKDDSGTLQWTSGKDEQTAKALSLDASSLSSGTSTCVAEAFFRHQKPYKKDLPLANGLWYEVARLDNALLKSYKNFVSEIDSGKFDAEDSFMMKTTGDYTPISIMESLFGSKKGKTEKRVMKLRVQVTDEEKSEMKFYPLKSNLLSIESKVVSFNPETHVLVGSVKRGYMVLFSRQPKVCGTPLDLGILRERVIASGFSKDQWHQLLCSYMDRYIDEDRSPSPEVMEYMHSLYVQKKWTPDAEKWKKFMASYLTKPSL